MEKYSMQQADYCLHDWKICASATMKWAPKPGQSTASPFPCYYPSPALPAAAAAALSPAVSDCALAGTGSKL